MSLIQRDGRGLHAGLEGQVLWGGLEVTACEQGTVWELQHAQPALLFLSF